MSAPQQTPQTAEEIQAFVAEELARVRESRRREERSLPREPLFWLAAVEQWTQPLFIEMAQRLLDWKAPRAEGFLRDLEQRGWLRRIEAARRKSNVTRLALLTLQRDVAERQIQERLETRRDRELWDNLAVLAEALGISIDNVAPSAVPDFTRRWTDLTVASIARDGFVRKVFQQGPKVESWQPSADELEQRIEASLSSGMPGQGQRWLEAAQPLASLLTRTLDTTLDVALRRSTLRLELYHRRRHDLKHLEHFLERADQLSALEQIVRNDPGDPGAPWALHLLGGGGVGKTMLIRHLTAQLADQEHWGLSIGRVDFDFLNPDYPRRSPGLLLWAFAQELRVFDTSGRVGQAFDDSERVLRQLHDQLHAGEESDDLLSHPLLHEGIEIYAQALEMLPQPVVFVIDTCEELTKPRAGTDGQFNVEATFAILQTLHARVPTLRVIFAGRRPLAEAGFGWACPQCTLPPRPFLRLFEMRGFSEAEAKSYLTERKVSSQLVEAVVQRSSPDSGSAAEIHWNIGQGPEDITRCNPYELHFYAEWALDEPPPSPEDIETAGGHRYVELRILSRLGHGPLESLLPLLGLARHADEALLQSVSGLDGEAFENLLRELENQEWMELRGTTSTQTSRRIYSVEEGLRLRLLSYCREHAGAMEAQRQLAADALRRRVLEGDPAELDGSDLDAALRVMESEPNADLWWRQVEDHLFDERDAEWVAQQAAYLVGPEGAATLPDDASWPELRTVHPLRPAVLATLALAESRQPGGGLTPWMEVAETAEALPNTGLDLALRARAMVLAAQHVNGFDLIPGDAWDLWQAMAELPGVSTPETVAALVAAAEALVEHYEEHRKTPGTEKLLCLDAESEAAHLAISELHRHFTGWADEAPLGWKDTSGIRPSEAMLLALKGRVIVRFEDKPEEATECFHEARALAAGQDGVASLQAWSPPRDFFSRLKLEAMRALYPRALSANECLNEFGARAPADGVEGDRFLSQLAELALALGPKSEVFADLLAQEADDPVHELECRAHFEIPPFAVRRGELLAASGQVEQGWKALQDILRQAASLDTTVVQQAARARLDLGIRLRFFDDAPSIPLADSPDSDDHHLIHLGEALGHPPMKRKAFSVQDSRRVMHRHWQTLKQPDVNACREAFGLARYRLHQRMKAYGDFDALDAHLVMDGWEALLLQGRDAFPEEDSQDVEATSEQQIYKDFSFAIRQAFDPTESPTTTWRLWLRREALNQFSRPGSELPIEPLLADLAHSLALSLGRHRAAMMAWREADLLALRLPAAASTLFGIARRLFAQAEAPLGEAICLTAQFHCLKNTPRSSRQPQPELDDLKALWLQLGAGLVDDPPAEPDAPLRPWWARARLLVLHSETNVSQDSAQVMIGGVDEPMLAWFFDPETVSEETDGSLSKHVEPSWDEHTGAFDVGLPQPIGFDIDGDGGSAPEDSAPEDSALEESTAPLPPPAPPAPISKQAHRPPKSEPSGEDSPPEEASQASEADKSPWWHAALPLVIGLGGGVVLVGIFALLVLGARWKTHLWGIEIPGIIWMAVLLMFGLSIGGMRRAVVAWLRLLQSLWKAAQATQELQLQIHITPVDSGRSGQSGAQIHPRRLRHRSFFQAPEVESLPDFSLEIESQRGSYDRQLSTLESTNPGGLSLSPGLAMTLCIDEEEDIPWEGIFGSREASQTLRFRRVAVFPKSSGVTVSISEPRWPDATSSASETRAVHLIADSDTTRHQLRQSWLQIEEARIRVQTEDLDTLFSLSAAPQQTERVLHLIGTPIASSAGFRWRLTTHQGKVFDLLADDIPRVFPELHLLILHETPVTEILRRSSADRRQAGYLRVFAAEIQQAGVPAVLTLPHMLPETASRCIQYLARLLTPYPIRISDRLAASDESLLDTVDAIRRHIRQDDAMDDEAAWDVVLYSPPGWRHPFQ